MRTRAGATAICVTLAAVGLSSQVLAAEPRASTAAERATKEECVRASDDGQNARDASHFARAREDFRICAAPACPALVRVDCSNWLQSLEDHSPTVVFGARDAAGNDVLLARVELDGTVVSDRLDGHTTSIDPGPHLLRFHGPGNETVEQQVVIRPGEKDRLVMVRFTGVASSLVSSTRPVPTGPEARKSGLAVASWIVGTASVAMFAGGLASGLVARHDLQGIEGQPCAATETCSSSAVDAVKTKLAVSDVLIGASAVGAAVTVTLVVIHFTRGRAQSASVAFAPISGGARGSLLFAF